MVPLANAFTSKKAMHCRVLLGGSRDFASKVISTLIEANYKYSYLNYNFITLATKSHDPLSRAA